MKTLEKKAHEFFEYIDQRAIILTTETMTDAIVTLLRKQHIDTRSACADALQNCPHGRFNGRVKLKDAIAEIMKVEVI